MAAAQYDITAQLVANLDRQLAIRLLDFVQGRKIYPDEDVLQEKYNVLMHTGMVDYCAAVYKEWKHVDTVPQELVDKRAAVLKKMEEYDAKMKPILAILQNPEVVQQLKQDKNQNQLQTIVQNLGFKTEYLDVMFEYAKFQYDIGRHDVAANLLYHCAALSTDAQKILTASWGKLAADLLIFSASTDNKTDVSADDVYRIRDLIDTKCDFTPLQQLQQRSWLLHWSMFVFFNHARGRDGIVDFFMQPQYLNTIQTTCPHILRYLTAAVITNKRRRSQLKELVKIIALETYQYRDPITDFVHHLYTDCDFDSAQKSLSLCEQVLENDYFLASTRDDFMQNARLFMFEVYCRIHQCIDIRGLSAKLNMDEENGERWIVNLIRDARLDAKIDSQAHTVIMGTQHKSIYQQLIEKSKDLSFRTQVLISNLEKKVPAVAAETPAVGH